MPHCPWRPTHHNLPARPAERSGRSSHSIRRRLCRAAPTSGARYRWLCPRMPVVIAHHNVGGRGIAVLQLAFSLPHRVWRARRQFPAAAAPGDHGVSRPYSPCDRSFAFVTPARRMARTGLHNAIAHRLHAHDAGKFLVRVNRPTAAPETVAAIYRRAAWGPERRAGSRPAG
jgi:hypothetical protein